jgi:hypothetical protein
MDAPAVPEVRTVSHIVSDLLQLALDGEWSGRSRQGCHCHPEYVSCCPDCDEVEYSDEEIRRESDGCLLGNKRNPHKPDCKRMKLIEESRAFLRVENALAEEREDWDASVHIP